MFFKTPKHTKFLILGTYRTGSNYLCSLLGSHPDVKVYYEIFHKKLPQLKEIFSESELSLRYKNPVQFLSKTIYRNDEEKKAIGFKLHYDQSRYQNLPKLMKWIRRKSDFYVIHIKRRNLLASFASQRVAAKSKVWSWSTPDVPAPNQVQIALTAEECVRYFESTVYEVEYYNAFFESHPVLEIFYEDLYADLNSQLAVIKDFLKLNPHPMTSRLQKQNSSCLTDVISNYEELKNDLANTRWKVFFEN